MRGLFVGMLGLAGCAQIFGIENTTAPDAPPGTVSLQIQRVSIGATIVNAPVDLTGQTADFLVPDATDPAGYRRVPAMITGTSNDTFSAIVPEGTPLIEFTLPEPAIDPPIKRLYALGRNLMDSMYVLEHPLAAPAPAGATLAAMVTLPSGYVGSESFQIYLVGPWASHGLSSAELPTPGVGATTISTGMIQYDAARFGTSAGRPLEAIKNIDLCLVLRYVGNDLTGLFEAPAFDQTGTDTVMGMMTNVTHNANLEVTIEPTRPAMRFANVRPPTTTLSMAYYLNAAPGYTYGRTNGPQLQAAGVAPTDSGMLTTAYGNPFVSHAWNTTLYWNTYASRTYTDPMTMFPMTLYTGLEQIAEPSAGLKLDHPQGLPISISLNQQGLLTDGQTLTADPAKAIDITATFDRATCLFYQAAIDEFIPNSGNTAFERHTIYQASMTTQNIKLPGGVLKTDTFYTIRMTCIQGGYPTFADGNLQNRTLPLSRGYLESGVFKVMP